MPTKTTAEVAVQLGVSKRTVHRMVQAGDLKPSYTFPNKGGAMLFDAADVARIIADRSAA